MAVNKVEYKLDSSTEGFAAAGNAACTGAAAGLHRAGQSPADR